MKAELAWAAGFFEGEGTIAMSGDRFTLQLKGTDLQPVDRFAKAVGCGDLYGPYRYDQIRKPFWVWSARGETALFALELLAPWLSNRRLSRALDLLPTLAGDIGIDADRVYARVRRIRRRNALAAQAE
jgi:hypothetical protein